MSAGLLAFVYRSPALGDCTNHGVTSRVDKVVLVHPDLPEITRATPDTPALVLRSKDRWDVPYWYAVPEDMDDAYLPMFGGNYVACTDARLRRVVGWSQAIPVHDRFE